MHQTKMLTETHFDTNLPKTVIQIYKDILCICIIGQSVDILTLYSVYATVLQVTHALPEWPLMSSIMARTAYCGDLTLFLVYNHLPVKMCFAT